MTWLNNMDIIQLTLRWWHNMLNVMERLNGVVARVKAEMVEEYTNKLMEETKEMNIKPMQNMVDALEVLKYTDVKVVLKEKENTAKAV